MYKWCYTFQIIKSSGIRKGNNGRGGIDRIYGKMGDFFRLRKNVGLNVGLNKTEKAVLGLLIEDSDRTADMIATEIGVTKRTIERTFVSLQKKGKIERIGSKRDGMWVVVK